MTERDEPYTPSLDEVRDRWGKLPRLQAGFDRMLDAERAETWDEGLKAGLREGNDKERGAVNNPALNPYRKEQGRG